MDSVNACLPPMVAKFLPARRAKGRARLTVSDSIARK